MPACDICTCRHFACAQAAVSFRLAMDLGGVSAAGTGKSVLLHAKHRVEKHGNQGVASVGQKC